MRGCLAHAARLYNSHEDAQVPQLHSALDAIAQRHLRSDTVWLSADRKIALFMHRGIR
jgi:hypothetical protein